MSGSDLKRARRSAARKRDDRIAELAMRVAALEDALRPFASAARVLKTAGVSRIVGVGGCTRQDFARAAELVESQ